MGMTMTIMTMVEERKNRGNRNVLAFFGPSGNLTYYTRKIIIHYSGNVEMFDLFLEDFTSFHTI